VGNKSNDWAYVITIIILALLFVLILPVLGFLYMDIRQERILIAHDLKRIERLKKEMEQQKEKSE
jgi:F0F1-type ATP synthase membrane subunit b/b'